jgi:hypothetical protein
VIKKSKSPSNTDDLLIRYRVEIYEKSFRNDPTVSFETAMPFQSINVGDYLTSGAWEVQPNHDLKKGQTLQVKAVQHILWKIEGSHVGHSLGICVDAVDQPNELFN